MQPVMYVVSSRGRRMAAAADGPRVSARVAERTREQAGAVSPADWYPPAYSEQVTSAAVHAER